MIGYHVLLVDDVQVNRKLMRLVLKEIADIDFYEAEDGFEAIRHVDDHEIDLIILDLMMPGKDGYEVLRDLKAHELWREIPVIVHSAADDLDSIKQALELGATEYFTKPLKPDQMKVILPLKVTNVLKEYDQRKKINRLNERMREELRLGQAFQQSLILKRRSYPSADVQGRYIPSNELGGDFYDVALVQDSLWFIMADVMGHGVAAAMVAAMITVLFQNALKELHDPGEVLEYLNRNFCRLTQETTLASAFVGVLRDKELGYANGGHPYPLFWKSSEKTIAPLAQNGFLLGVLETAQYKTARLTVKPGDTLVLYTDGLLDAKFPEAYPSMEELQHRVLAAKQWFEEDTESFLREVLRPFLAQGVQIPDDVALMVLSIK